MKTILLLTILFVFTACGNQSAKLNDEKYPYIISTVEKHNSTHSRYYAHCRCGYSANLFNLMDARIVLPTGLYTVGDTIVFKTD